MPATGGYDGGTSGGPGNPTSFKGTANTFNADNQVTNAGYGYDGAGNPTTYKGSALTFDPENRLTAYGSAQTDCFSGDGLRAWKQTGGGKTYFLYDGSEPVCEYGSTGTLTATNTFGADGLLSRRSVSGSATTFYTFDERGDVAQQLNSSASVQSSDLYDSYGSRTGTVSLPDPWGYEAQAGYYTDAETGLVLCTNRFYDPATGRFLTRDPIDYDGGINLYGYCGNDPVNQSDPDGFEPRKGPGVKQGPGGTTYAQDMNEKPHPDMHIWHHEGETVITPNGGWRSGVHKGAKLTPLPNRLRRPYRYIIRDFCKKALKYIPIPDLPPQLEILDLMPVLPPPDLQSLMWERKHPGIPYDSVRPIM